jgi:lysophospholipase L1-like esterase
VKKFRYVLILFSISFASLFVFSEYGAGMDFIGNIFGGQNKSSYIYYVSKDSIQTSDTLKQIRHTSDTLKQIRHINIGNDSAIINFYNKLTKIENDSLSKLTIYHFGDSHIKGGFLPKAIKAKFDEDYKGIAYKSFGIDGASFRTFLHKKDYLNTIEKIKPDIIIISLGTNDASGETVFADDFLKTVDEVIRAIRKIDSGTDILFTTPPDYVMRGNVNKNTAIIRDLLIEYALENDIAYWDLFEFMGGEGSCLKWFDEGLMAKDKIHFTKSGYEKQAEMFYDALIGN